MVSKFELPQTALAEHASQASLRDHAASQLPNDAALNRLVSMLLIEQNDEWAVDRRCFSLASMAKLDEAPEPPLALEAM